MNAIVNSLQSRSECVIESAAPDLCLGNAVVSADAGSGKTSSSKRGGARPNSGGPRANSGGARPNCGGPQPGSGRPRKIVSAPVYAVPAPVWCVIAFWGQAEQSATQTLAQDGYDVHLPLTAVRKQDPVFTTLWHTVRVPLFSGYGFIRLTQTESREPIVAVRGVREILRRPDGKAAWVPDALIAQLIEDAPSRLELPVLVGDVLPVGTRVRILAGAFVAYPGTVLECDGTQTLVEINIFGRMVPFWVARVALEVLS